MALTGSSPIYKNILTFLTDHKFRLKKELNFLQSGFVVTDPQTGQSTFVYEDDLGTFAAGFGSNGWR